MFGAFQFQYTMDFFLNQDLWQKWYVTPLDATFLLTACFKKEVVLTMVLSLYYTFDRGAMYMNNRENRFSRFCLPR